MILNFCIPDLWLLKKWHPYPPKPAGSGKWWTVAIGNSSPGRKELHMSPLQQEGTQMGMYRDIGEWEDAETLRTMVAAQVSLSPGRDRHNFFFP